MKARSFDEYMIEVNRCIQGLTGLSADDLPDWRYYDDYEDDISPVRCARRAIKYAQDS